MWRTRFWGGLKTTTEILRVAQNDGLGLLAVLHSGTHLTAMPLPSARLCRHPVQRYRRPLRR
jgi:hypothetical protein